MDLTNKKMLFLGDSITEGVGTSSIENVYWKRFESDGATVKGYGISGTRIAKQQVPTPDHPEWDNYFRNRVCYMEDDADVVVVFGGTNDYGHGDAAIGSFSDRCDDTFYGALHNLYSDLINKYPKAQIVVMTPCHRLNENNYYNDFGVRAAGNLKKYVDIIKEVAQYYAIAVLDLYSLSGIQPDIEVNKNLYIPDGVHPSDEGHKKIYSLLKGFLNNL